MMDFFLGGKYNFPLKKIKCIDLEKQLKVNSKGFRGTSNRTFRQNKKWPCKKLGVCQCIDYLKLQYPELTLAQHLGLMG